MSNAMSRSKSRWKGALLAGAAMAIVSPLAAKAQTGLTVNLYTDPLGGGGSPNDYANTTNGNPLNNVYIDPFSTDTLYVYATVTGTAAPSPTYVDGLDYLYFNINAAQAGTSTPIGSFSAATPSFLFGGGNFNQTNGNPSAGAQGGALSPISTTAGIVVGSNSSLGSVAKPRGSTDWFYNGSAGTVIAGSTGGTYQVNNLNGSSNVVVSGNSVSFLVETLTYTPSVAAPSFQSSQGSPVSIALNVSTPSSTVLGTNYVADNYFVGLPAAPGTGGLSSSPGLLGYNTSSSYSGSTTQVSLTSALPGDVNLDGTVNSSDFIKLVQNLNNLHNNGAQYTSPQWSLGDINGDGYINSTDFIALVQHLNLSLGNGPQILAQVEQYAVATGQVGAVDAALAANPTYSSVPEPATLSFVVFGGAAALCRRRRSSPRVG